MSILAIIAAVIAGPGACRADFDRDGVTTVLDWQLFHNTWLNGDIAADFDRDGILTERDELLYMEWWWKCWNNGG